MAQGESKLLFPGLAGLYPTWRDIAEMAARVVIGYNLFMRGSAKVTGAGVAGLGAFMAKRG